jgi:hypothetical protein
MDAGADVVARSRPETAGTRRAGSYGIRGVDGPERTVNTNDRQPAEEDPAT